ncbi:hypothetical protein SAMN02910447_02041 [Ruminococcus sp. YE71]|uniref:hypothetical protein n=2 Tax=unclassified Ruminococcus TaxID=2608920 RepID=UPI0009086732|nr:hypothetical protein [Ruminococcus sp. YE71]SFW35969.1 hypothetical protein SAMN02910447_02041 [Ruminococcus sp. YE71]
MRRSAGSEKGAACLRRLFQATVCRAMEHELSAFFFDTLGLQSRLSDLGIDDRDFAVMAKKACGQYGMRPGFTDLTPKDVEAIYRMCL